MRERERERDRDDIDFHVEANVQAVAQRQGSPIKY